VIEIQSLKQISLNVIFLSYVEADVHESEKCNTDAILDLLKNLDQSFSFSRIELLADHISLIQQSL